MLSVHKDNIVSFLSIWDAFCFFFLPYFPS